MKKTVNFSILKSTVSVMLLAVMAVALIAGLGMNARAEEIEPESSEPTCNLTIHYQYKNGDPIELCEPFEFETPNGEKAVIRYVLGDTTTSLKPGTPYTVISPEIPGYVPSMTRVGAAPSRFYPTTRTIYRSVEIIGIWLIGVMVYYGLLPDVIDSRKKNSSHV